MQQAIDAQRRYYSAQDAGQPAEEVERLRRETESLYQAVTDYRLRSLGKHARSLH
jgi:hypothetical protein